jgi:hypothetical protein
MNNLQCKVVYISVLDIDNGHTLLVLFSSTYYVCLIIDCSLDFHMSADVFEY